jgi:hypothetical protein
MLTLSNMLDVEPRHYARSAQEELFTLITSEEFDGLDNDFSEAQLIRGLLQVAATFCSHADYLEGFGMLSWLDAFKYGAPERI